MDLEQMVAQVPANFDQARVDYAAYAEFMAQEGITEDAILTLTWCSFSVGNIEANVDGPTLAAIHSGGVFASIGKRSVMGQKPKYKTISYADCREFGPVDHEDPRRYGRFGIEFAGPGGVLLGRLQWNWRAKRFGDSRREIMAVAAERDRVLEIVKGEIG